MTREGYEDSQANRRVGHMEEGSSGYIRHAEVRVADAIPERNRDHFFSISLETERLTK